MSDQTGKKGPRLDDQLKHETEGLVRGGGPTHAEGFTDPEPVETDTGRDPTSARGSRAQGTPPGMTPRDVEDRTAFARVLAGVRYPVTPRELARYAAEEGAPDVAVAALERLPDRSYERLAEVIEGLGYGHETRRT